MGATQGPRRPEAAERVLAALSNADGQGNLSGYLTEGERKLIYAIGALLRDRLGERGGTDDDIDLKWLGRESFECGIKMVRAELKPVRHTAPIKRVHEDKSECTHKIGPNGQPLPGQGCPGPAAYTATCKAAGCDWTHSAGIRAIVEDAKRTHLHSTRVAAR